MDALSFCLGALTVGAPLVIVLIGEVRRKELAKIAARPTTKAKVPTAAFAVPDTDALWRAVNETLNEVEWETIEGARNATADSNRCIAAVGAGEGVSLARLRLQELREAALKRKRSEGLAGSV